MTHPRPTLDQFGFLLTSHLHFMPLVVYVHSMSELIQGKHYSATSTFQLSFAQPTYSTMLHITIQGLSNN